MVIDDMIGAYAKNLSTEEKEAIANIFTKEYYEQTYFNGVSYASHLMLQLFRNMGILDLLKTKYSSCAEIICEFNFIPNARHALEWMLAFLHQGGFLKMSESKDGRRYFYENTVAIEPEIFLQKGLALDKKILPTANLMEYVLSEYPNFFTGKKKGFEILFAQDKMTLWNEYFSNDNSGYCVYNSLGTFGVLKWASGRNNIRLLEVGAGTGGASAALIDKLKERNQLSRISEYIFSDVSAAFLRIGNRAIMNRVGDDFNYSLKRLDFEKSLVEQGIKENDIDIVYAVNALHVAKNLAGSLKNIYEVISPGGAIVLSEYCRPNENYLLLQEFIFNLLDNYTKVDLDSDLRPLPGFLDYEHWRRNLEAAGFKNIEAIFNTDGSYPADLRTKIDILATVIKGEKSAA
jgi:SAM-dependent methyltransferase